MYIAHPESFRPRLPVAVLSAASLFFSACTATGQTPDSHQGQHEHAQATTQHGSQEHMSGEACASLHQQMMSHMGGQHAADGHHMMTAEMMLQHRECMQAMPAMHMQMMTQCQNMSGKDGETADSQMRGYCAMLRQQGDGSEAAPEGDGS